MKTSAQKRLIRLEALPQRPARLRVDRSFPGRIQGVSLLTTGPTAGHDFAVDKTTVEQVTEFAPGIRGRWTHGGLSDDGLGRHLGKWESVRTEPFWLCRACATEGSGPVCAVCQEDTEVEWRSVGDFAFARSAHRIRPDGLDVPAPVYLMDRAEEDPESLGISVVAHFQFDQAPAAGEDDEPRRLARIASKRDLRRGDWVADPAANPVGLHVGTAAPSELTEGATRALDRIVAREGRAKARLRALSFLARYFGDDLGGEDDDDDDDDEHSVLRTRIEAQAGEIAALRAGVESFQASEQTRKQAESDTYLEELRVRSAELNAPISASELEKVERLLEAGNLDIARTLGKAFLARSEAQDQVPFRRKGTHSLGLDKGRRKASVDVQIQALRQRGFTVEVTGDGTEILNTTPPKEGAQ